MLLLKRTANIFLFVILVLLSVLFPGSGNAQESEPAVETLFASMSVEERVGQLFLIPFEGDTLTADSEIVDLIRSYKVGGVIFLSENDNVTGYGNPEETPRQLLQLANDLQSLSLFNTVPEEIEEEDTQETDVTPTAAEPTPTSEADAVRLPLFLAMSHEGQGADSQYTVGGFTAVPTNMAIGATWQPVHAREIGKIVGQELSAVGINMLLGPTLDVLENPAPSNPADLGTNTLGGDPYWVGRLGQAYTAGVHEGSSSRIAVIAKNFPGKGSSDRPTDQEVPTVRKSLEQLKQIELAPFMAVTGLAPDTNAEVDGMLSTHIRYQGFQGNIRATTAPVSFDPQALNSLMAMPEFVQWRQNGGLLVSDALGVRSVERFYDDTEQEFPHRVIAKDALLAGNDILYLGEFALSPESYAEQSANIRDTISWFREKYLTDQSFQQRVDEAVKRIIGKKLSIYGNDWSAANVLASEDNLQDRVDRSEAAVFDLAQDSTTLISPSLPELAERLSSPPNFNDSIVVFTEIRDGQQCSYCPEDAVISETAIADRLIALYGPEASNQVARNQVSSFTFSDLDEFLDAGGVTIVLPTVGPTPTTDPEDTSFDATPFLTPTPSAGFLVQEALRDADWIVFGLLDHGAPSSALERFLAERPDIIRDKRVLVFAFDAPYYLDTTEISKLTAYYGLYSTSDVFVDLAVRTMFMEAPLDGNSPVSIEGIDYNLFTTTQPDPQQIIELNITSNVGTQPLPDDEPLQAEIGETLHLETGVIVDHNGNQVPDGTIVQFIQQDRIQGTLSIIDEVPTSDGVARLGYVLEASTGPGQFRITAASGEATISQAVDISIEGESEVIIVVPTIPPTPTSTPSPTPTATPSPTATATAVPPTATAVPPAAPEEPGIRIKLSELEMIFSMLSGLLLFSVAALFAGRHDNNSSHRAGALLWGTIGGLTAYIYTILQMPGTNWVLSLGSWAGITATLIGAITGWLIYMLLTSDRTSQVQDR